MTIASCQHPPPHLTATPSPSDDNNGSGHMPANPPPASTYCINTLSKYFLLLFFCFSSLHPYQHTTMMATCLLQCYDNPPASRFNVNMPSRFYFILLFFLYTWVPPVLWWQQWQQWQPCHHQHPTACPHWPHPKYWCQHTPSNLVSFFLHLSAAMITTGGGSHHHQCSIQLHTHTWSTHPQWQWSPSHPLALNHTAVHMHTQSTHHTAAVTMMTTNNFC